MFLHLEKMEYFFLDLQLEQQQKKDEVKLFSEPSQLSFVKVDISKQSKEIFKCLNFKTIKKN